VFIRVNPCPNHSSSHRHTVPPALSHSVCPAVNISVGFGIFAPTYGLGGRLLTMVNRWPDRQLGETDMAFSRKQDQLAQRRGDAEKSKIEPMRTNKANWGGVSSLKLQASSREKPYKRSQLAGGRDTLLPQYAIASPLQCRTCCTSEATAGGSSIVPNEANVREGPGQTPCGVTTNAGPSAPNEANWGEVSSLKSPASSGGESRGHGGLCKRSQSGGGGMPHHCGVPSRRPLNKRSQLTPWEDPITRTNKANSTVGPVVQTKPIWAGATITPCRTKCCVSRYGPTALPG
jgi:hypothetical protein